MCAEVFRAAWPLSFWIRDIQTVRKGHSSANFFSIGDPGVTGNASEEQMYLTFFGLNETPFGSNPDSLSFYLGPAHQETLASLTHGIEAGTGSLAMVAGTGMGKTAILFRLADQYRDSPTTVLLLQMRPSPESFLKNLLTALGAEPSGCNLVELQRQFLDAVAVQVEAGKRIVVAIDEAESLDDATLEMLQTLLADQSGKFLQLVLAGRPELTGRLSCEQFQQLRQKISTITSIRALRPGEVAAYIQDRLRFSGYQGPELFTPAAVQLIAERTGGVPGLINDLCSGALTVAFMKNRRVIDERALQAAGASESDTLEPPGEVETPRRLPGSLTSGDNSQNSESVPRAEANPASAHRSSQRSNAAGKYTSLLDDTAFATEFLRLDANARTGKTPGSGTPLAHFSSHRSRGPALLLVALVILGVVLVGAWLKFGFWPDTSSPDDADVQAVDKRDANPGMGALLATAEAASPPRNGSTPGIKLLSAANRGTISSMTPEKKDTAQIAPTPPPAALASAKPAKMQSASPTVVPAPPVDDLGRRGPAGMLVVDSNPGGAHIGINGHAASDWVTPHLFALTPGVYTVSVIQSGYMIWTRQVELDRVKEKWLMADFQGTPQVNKGILIVEMDLPGMQVWVDDRLYRGNRIQAVLPAGWHAFKVVPGPDSQPYATNFYLSSGEAVTKRVRVTSTSAPPGYAVRLESFESPPPPDSRIGNP